MAKGLMLGIFACRVPGAFSDNKLLVSLRMPTPEPGSYDYPPGNAWNNPAYPGNPEAFSMWVFVFNDPASCVGGGPGICG